jgi:glyoxylase-like metal-dependent hydrolase (beta-lactamase superfamily II)
MQIHVLQTGYFKLDGGAMFGVVPKTIWQKQIPADENNLCNWQMRCLLVNTGKRLILIDTGMGDKQPEKWLNFYQRSQTFPLRKAIMEAGYSPNEVTDVILSHLHFDHCGGAVQWTDDRSSFELACPNAKYWTHSAHYDSAVKPNAREKATFLTENIQPIVDAGQLFFVDEVENPWGEQIEYLVADGHTEKMIMPLISYRNKSILFIADTIPSHAHIHVPYVMGYDIRPIQTMLEKDLLLQRIVREELIVCFDHDPVYDMATVQLTEKGYRAKDLGDFRHFFGV